MENKEKVGMTKLNWILSIGGIILLVILMFLPPLFRIVFEEKEVIKQDNTTIIDNDTMQEEIDDDIYSKVVCMMQTTNTNYIENYTVTLAHQNNQLEIITEDITHTYLFTSKEAEEAYNAEKFSCTSNTITGMIYTCTSNDDTIHTVQKVDLSKTTSDNTVIYYSYHQDISELTTTLTSLGYTCQ